MSWNELNERRADLLAEQAKIHAAAEAAKPPGFTTEQAKRDDEIVAELGTIDANIARHKARVAQEQQLPREIRDAAEFAEGARITSAEKGPFRLLGDQLVAIAAAARPGGHVDARLYRVMELQAGPSGGSANVGSDGGFLIQHDFAVDLMKQGFAAAQLASRCSTTEIGANSDGLEVVYTDETSRATGSRWGGVRVYRVAEAETVTASRPKMGKWELRLEDLMGIAYATERLLQDASAIESWYREAFEDEFAFVIDDEIYRGNGVGQCLGILAANSPLVTVAKEGGQANDTIVAENIMKMWARVLPRSKANGIWVVNTEVLPYLQGMMIGTGASGQLVFMPPGGLSGQPYGTIYGRPVLEIEHASAIGDVGDIAFLDLSQYKLIRKGGIQFNDSIHVRFLYNERAFRWVARVNGAPKLKTAITPYKGSGTLSNFVTLAAR